MPEVDRLHKTLELRQLINAHYVTAEVRPVRTRTIRGLIDETGEKQAMSARPDSFGPSDYAMARARALDLMSSSGGAVAARRSFRSA